MTRVLFVSAEPVGEVMAGPAIRVVELARAVAEHCEVTVAAPPPSDPDVVPGRLVPAELADFETLLEGLRGHDVAVAQRMSPQLLRYAARLPVRFVADLYNPMMIEVLEAAGDEGGESAWRRAWRSMLGQCAVADFVICAAEKQRDLWLGGMALNGLVHPSRYRSDPTFRDFVDVVPFGLPDDPPRHEAPVLKGVAPGIAAEDSVLLWAGGVWRWLDALTPIRAVERLRARRPDVQLVFMGTGRPALEPRDVPTSVDEVVRYARERGLDGNGVHFKPGWVPYAERGAYLLEADVGVCAHHDHLEARFSFRTRVLDHFWAGLPSVVSSGDSIGELVEREGLGRAVAPDDVDGFAAALEELLGDRDRRERVAERVRRFAPGLRWSECARPLVEFCLDPDRRAPAPTARAAVARATFGQYRDVLAALRDHGGLGEAAKAIPRHLARALRHRA